MNHTIGWFAAVRAVLELLYFASGIAIAIAAFWALKQLKITKQIARTNAKREALKLAAHECRVYAKEVVPVLTKFVAEYLRLKLTCLSTQPQFRIENGEIVGHSFSMPLLQNELPQILAPLVEYLNAVEAFAIFFVSGVADDELGFQETAIAFCQTTGAYMPVYFYARQTNMARYESTIKLFDMWNRRIVANAARLTIKPLGDLIRASERDRIKPIGTED